MNKKDKFLLFLADLLAPSEKSRIVEKIEDSDKVVIYSTYHLTNEEINFLKTKFDFISGKEIKNIIKREIIGGVIISYQDKIIDLSLRGRLIQLKRLINENKIQ